MYIIAPNHTRKTVEALQKNELASKSMLFIYSDAAKNMAAEDKVNEVRDYINTIDGFKKVTVIKRENNWGLANSIIDGVTKIVNEYGKIIVLEDDLVTSTYFLKFMNDALDFYENNKEVVCIHGYQYPLKDSSHLPDTFFIKGADCWGWATWTDGWIIFETEGKKLLKELQTKKLQREADFNNSFAYTKMLKDQIKGKNNSWAIRWYMSAFLKNKLTLYPKKSLVQNIGFDNSGTHSNLTEHFFIKDMTKKLPLLDKSIQVTENHEAKKFMEEYFKSIKLNFFSKSLIRIKRLIGL